MYSVEKVSASHSLVPFAKGSPRRITKAPSAPSRARRSRLKTWKMGNTHPPSSYPPPAPPSFLPSARPPSFPFAHAPRCRNAARPPPCPCTGPASAPFLPRSGFWPQPLPTNPYSRHARLYVSRNACPSRPGRRSWGEVLGRSLGTSWSGGGDGIGPRRDGRPPDRCCGMIPDGGAGGSGTAMSGRRRRVWPG